jgi:uncharacterized membrane protein
MKTLSRLMRHLFTTTASGRRLFPEPTLKAIQATIATGEKVHRAEVRLIVEPSLTLMDVLRKTSAREQARELFTQYRIWDTEENCGILIYVNLADHKVEIIADRTIGRLLTAHEWQAVCKTMTQGFARGEYHDSAVAGFRQLNELLAVRFPSDGSTVNELTNRPIIL